MEPLPQRGLHHTQQRDINWNELLSPNSPYFNIDRKIMELEDKFIPTSEPKSDTKVTTFPIDKKTHEMIKHKHALARKANRSGKIGDCKAYNRHRNKVKQQMKKLHKNFENDLASKAKTNPKAVWNYMYIKTKVDIGNLKMNPSDPNSVKTDKDEKEPEGDLPDGKYDCQP